MIKFLKENIATIRQSIAYTAIMAAAAVASFFVPEIVIPIVTLAIAVISLDFLFFNYFMQSQKKTAQEATQPSVGRTVSFDDDVYLEEKLTSGATITSSLMMTDDLSQTGPAGASSPSTPEYSPAHLVRSTEEVDLGSEDDQELGMPGDPAPGRSLFGSEEEEGEFDTSELDTSELPRPASR